MLSYLIFYLILSHLLYPDGQKNNIHAMRVSNSLLDAASSKAALESYSMNCDTWKQTERLIQWFHSALLYVFVGTVSWIYYRQKANHLPM